MAKGAREGADKGKGKASKKEKAKQLVRMSGSPQVRGVELAAITRAIGRLMGLGWRPVKMPPHCK